MILRFVTIIVLSLLICKSETLAEKDKREMKFDPSPSASGSADDLIIVDCQLPSIVVGLGQTKYIKKGKIIKSTLRDCRIKGGTCQINTPLKVWLDQARGGDKEAQTYVGEVYERGIGVETDYLLAAKWYEEAAGGRKGSVRAQINLGRLYEEGRGVPQDMGKALNLYRKASGLKEAITFDAAGANAVMEQKLNELRKELKRRKEHSDALQQKVDRIKEDLEGTRHELEQTKAETETERQKLKEAEEQLEMQKKQAASTGENSKIKILEGQLKKQKADFEKQKKEVSVLSKQVVELNAKAQGLEKTQLELEQEKRKTEIERKKLEHTRQQLEITQNELERKKKEAEIELNKLEEERSGLEKQRKQAEAAGNSTKQKELKDQLKQREVDLNNHKKEIAELYQDIAALDIKTKNMEQTCQQLVNTQKELEQKKSVAESEHKKLEETQQQLDKVQSELAKKRENADIVRKKYEEALNELEKERNQTAGSRATVKILEEYLDDHKAELGRKESELSTLVDRVADLEALNTKLLDESRKREKISEIAGPVITMVNPEIASTRSITTIKTPGEKPRLIEGKVTAPAGLGLFTINNREVKPDINGEFTEPVLVQHTNVPVKIVATDKQGKEAVVVFQLTPDKPAKKKGKGIPRKIFGNYHALIIGNTKYEHLQNLETPIKDAEAIAEVLRSKYDFKTEVLKNAKRAAILEALYKLRKKLTGDDNLLIYYAGHGQLVKEIDIHGRGYWIPCDGENDNSTNWISTFDITDRLSRMKARHILVVSDSCYSGAFITKSIVDTDLLESEKARRHLIKILVKKQSRHILSSGDLQPVLDGGGSGHSVFAKAVLDALRNNDEEVLEGFRLHKHVQAGVAFAASNKMIEQIPQYAPLMYSDHERGKFFFVQTKGM